MLELGSQGHPMPVLYCTVIYDLFSLQTDKTKQYSSVLHCSTDQDMCVFSEMIINNERKIGQLCCHGLSKGLGFKHSQICLLVPQPTIQVIWTSDFTTDRIPMETV